MLSNEFAPIWTEIPNRESKQKMKVADSKCLLVSNSNVQSLARTVVLRQNMNVPAGHMNMLTKYTQRHFNMPLACGNLHPSL